MLYKPIMKRTLSLYMAVVLMLVLVACGSSSPVNSTESTGFASGSSRPNLIGSWSRIDTASGVVEVWRFTKDGYVEQRTSTFGTIKLPYKWVDDNHIRVDHSSISVGRPIITVWEVHLTDDALTIRPEGGTAITLNRVNQ